MKRSTATPSKLRKLAATLAAALAFGSIGSAALTEGVAHAGTTSNYVSQSDLGTLTVVGGPEDNDMYVRLVTGVFTITDTKADLTTTSPCRRVERGTVTCPAVANVTDLILDGQAGNDTLRGIWGNDVIKGGPGDDSLWGGSGLDSLEGGDGADRLYGQDGNDTLDGGAGRTLDRGDYISGGLGTDRVTYLAKVEGVWVSLNGKYDDGMEAYEERDNVDIDVENVTGTRYDDVLVGNDGPNSLYGTWGNDSLWGRDGSDHLYGELGRDAAFGEAGNDYLHQSYSTSTGIYYEIPGYGSSRPSDAALDVDAVSDCGSGTDYLYRDSEDPTRSQTCEY